VGLQIARTAARIAIAACVMTLVIETGACGLGRAPRPAPIDPGDVVADHGPPAGIDVVWIGHATALIRIEDRWFLTDPNFSDRVGLVYERYVEPGMQPDELPPLDAVLVSHAHMDHLDPPSLRRVRAPLVVAPPDALRYVPDDAGFADRQPLDRWQSVARDGVTITAVPASHGAGRYYIDAAWAPNSYAGFVIEYRSHTVYFAGDTGYRPELFAEIGRRFDIDVALLPVGPADRPGWVHALREEVHAGPNDALRIFDEVGADWMVPIHFGTFFKRTAGERAAIAGAIHDHPRGDHVALLRIGGVARFPARTALTRATPRRPARRSR
jgi:L-ascorbate metabolism protein UlaG (beta-lactamase superfamily)